MAQRGAGNQPRDGRWRQDWAGARGRRSGRERSVVEAWLECRAAVLTGAAVTSTPIPDATRGWRAGKRSRPDDRGSATTATRVMPGTTSLSISSHLPREGVLKDSEAGDIAARPRETCNKAVGDRIGDQREHDRNGLGHAMQRFQNGARRLSRSRPD